MAVWEEVVSLGDLTVFPALTVSHLHPSPLQPTLSCFPVSYHRLLWSWDKSYLYFQSLPPLRLMNSRGCYPACKVGQPFVYPHFFQLWERGAPPPLSLDLSLAVLFLYVHFSVFHTFLSLIPALLNTEGSDSLLGAKKERRECDRH